MPDFSLASLDAGWNLAVFFLLLWPGTDILIYFFFVILCSSMDEDQWRRRNGRQDATVCIHRYTYTQICSAHSSFSLSAPTQQLYFWVLFYWSTVSGENYGFVVACLHHVLSCNWEQSTVWQFDLVGHGVMYWSSANTVVGLMSMSLFELVHWIQHTWAKWGFLISAGFISWKQ